MDVMLIRSLVLALSFCAVSVMGLRCKCTKESNTVTCSDGVCDIDKGSCLMLDHPTMGIHYTCYGNGLRDEQCYNKTSKSGVSVRICACDSSDFCNYAFWPER